MTSKNVKIYIVENIDYELVNNCDDEKYFLEYNNEYKLNDEDIQKLKNTTIVKSRHDEHHINNERIDSLFDKFQIKTIHTIVIDFHEKELQILESFMKHLYNVEYIYIKNNTNKMEMLEVNHILTHIFNFKISNKSDYVEYKNVFLKDPLFQTIKLSNHEQTYIRGKPKEYLLHTINMFKNFTNSKLILEIGSIRSKMDHSIEHFKPNCCNDGHSTYFFSHYTNAEIFTVDIDPRCKSIIESDSRLQDVNAINTDAMKYATGFDKNIDLLFLDAWDVVPNSPYAEAHLDIYNILKKRLSPKCIIVIDDTDVGNGGKGKLLIPQLLNDGFLMIVNRRQSIFLKK